MSNIRVDDSSVQRMFTKARNKTFKNAAKEAAKALTKETRREFKKAVGSVANHRNYWNGKTLQSGIKYRLAKEAKDTYKVHIMGDFRLKFFESGTKQRKTKKTKRNRGRLKALNFFATARKDEGKYLKIMRNKILDELQ